MVVSQETLSPSDVWIVDGVAVTTPVRTTFDCLRLLRGVERLVVADAMTHLRRTTVEELRTYWKTQRRLRNLRVAELLLDDVEPASESPPETRLRVRLVEFGLPRPVAQWEVRSPSGSFVARLDLAYPDRQVAVEYDGAWYWQQRRADDRRRDALRALGWVVIVVSAEDLRDAAAVAARVRSALRQASMASTAT